MNISKCLRACAQLRRGIFSPCKNSISTDPRASETQYFSRVALDVYKVSNPANISFLPCAIKLMNVPTPKIRIEILDPFFNKGFEKKAPTNVWRIDELSLPDCNDKEIREPAQQIVEKRAARLIVIRRAKMKKHKWRKLQKRMRFAFARKRQRRELKKEKAFQAMLLAQVKEAEDFDAKDYVMRQLQTTRWEQPITRVRGFYAPEAVIRDYQRIQEKEKEIKERIEDCLRYKNKS